MSKEVTFLLKHIYGDTCRKIILDLQSAMANEERIERYNEIVDAIEEPIFIYNKYHSGTFEVPKKKKP